VFIYMSYSIGAPQRNLRWEIERDVLAWFGALRWLQLKKTGARGPGRGVRQCADVTVRPCAELEAAAEEVPDLCEVPRLWCRRVEVDSRAGECSRTLVSLDGHERGLRGRCWVRFAGAVFPRGRFVVASG
jgi:hypothetical protein